MFLERYKPKGDNSRISCVKKMDGSSLPPCSKVLMQKTRRSFLVSSVWNNATLVNNRTLNPINFGWIIKDSCYRINWFDGEFSPRCCDVTSDSTTEDEDDDESDSDDEIDFDSDTDTDDEDD